MLSRVSRTSGTCHDTTRQAGWPRPHNAQGDQGDTSPRHAGRLLPITGTAASPCACANACASTRPLTTSPSWPSTLRMGGSPTPAWACPRAAPPRSCGDASHSTVASHCAAARCCTVSRGSGRRSSPGQRQPEGFSQAPRTRRQFHLADGPCEAQDGQASSDSDLAGTCLSLVSTARLMRVQHKHNVRHLHFHCSLGSVEQVACISHRDTTTLYLSHAAASRAREEAYTT